MTDPTTEALHRFRERVNTFIDLAIEEAREDEVPTDWADVIVQDAAIIAGQGAEAYLAYVRDLHAAAYAASAERRAHLALVPTGGLS